MRMEGKGLYLNDGDAGRLKPGQRVIAEGLVWCRINHRTPSRSRCALAAQPPTDGGVPLRPGEAFCWAPVLPRVISAVRPLVDLLVLGAVLPRGTKARAPRHACTVAIFFRPQPSRRPRPSPALLVYTSPQDDEGSSAPPLSCSRSSPAWARSPEDERNHGGRPVRMHPTRATRVYEVLPGHRQEGKRRKGQRGCIPAGRWEARTSSRS
jgi:hypothetical protein